MFRYFRIVILLFILLLVAQTAWVARSRSVEWKFSLPVVIHPIAGDDSPVTAAHVAALGAADFESVGTFMRREAEGHGIVMPSVVSLRVGRTIVAQPPAAPGAGDRLGAIAWSLRMRWWAWRSTSGEPGGLQVRVFVRYFDPARTPRVAHSLGLQKGLLGMVNAFAAEHMTQDNNVIIVHELLHALGASDKYDPATNLPLHPDGYAEPDAQPLLPQRKAEIMGGRIPLAPGRAETPRSLDFAVIGPATAREINWRR